jgi:uncharacterized membrane protein
MKTMLVIAIAVMTASVCGCRTDAGIEVSPEKGFSVTAPMGTTTIKQGDTQTVTVSLNRERYFKQDVVVDVETSEGIEVEPEKVEVEAGDLPDVRLQITVPKDAPIGEYQVRVVATPETGVEKTEDFTVQVVAP